MATKSEAVLESSEYVDTTIFTSKNQVLGGLTVKELLVATILGIMGGFISQLIPFSAIMKIVYPFYGGQQLMSGHHLIWMAIAYGMTRKNSSILMTAFMKGIIESLLGDNWGFLILALNLFEGLSLLLGFWLFKRLKEDYSKLGWALAGGLGNFTQAPVFWTLNGRWAYVETTIAIIAFIFAFFSGCLITGLLARQIVILIRDAMGDSTAMFKLDIEERKKLPVDPFENAVGLEIPPSPDFMEENAVINVKDFSFRYYGQNYDIINNANFTINKGEFILLFGPSGSGKSTLCYSLTSVIPWSIRGMYKGDIYVLSNNLKSVPPNQLAGEIGLLMQNPDNQFVNLTVEDEIIFGVENLGLEKAEIENRYQEIVKLLDLQDLILRNVTQLSGGEKQRVILASILMLKPKILVLDEPFAYLDLQTRRELLYYLIEIKEQLQKDLTIIIAEHRVAELIKHVDRCLEINNGHVNLIEDPKSLSLDYFLDYYLQHEEQHLSSFKKHYIKSIKSNGMHYKEMLEIFNFEVSAEKDQRNPVIEFDSVSFYYNQHMGKYGQRYRRILHNVSFMAYKGDIVAIIGDNGRGKTTLLYLIAGILKPESGSISYENKILSELPYQEYAQKVGLILQNPESQLLKSSIEDEIKFGPRNFGKLDDITVGAFQELVEFVFHSQAKTIRQNLDEDEDLQDFNPFKLSWGQKRRLNLASLYSYDPEIYLLDEPFTGQDLGVRTELMGELLKILHTNKVGFICSHDMEVLEFCNKAILMDEDGLTIYKKRTTEAPEK